MVSRRRGSQGPQISPERLAEIEADARSGIHWADVYVYGPACACGLVKAERCYRHDTVQEDPPEAVR